MLNLWCLPQRKRSRDELHRTLTKENQRLRQAMNLNGCAAMQCTSRVPPYIPCGLHACTCSACGTLEGFSLPMAGSCCQLGDKLLDSCGGFARKVGQKILLYEVPRIRSFNAAHEQTQKNHCADKMFARPSKSQLRWTATLCIELGPTAKRRSPHIDNIAIQF